jgi:dipeptidyl aminopeptidase/acylaminoacyl peptidase
MRHGVEAKFLYFPDENHWILKPPHVRIWYRIREWTLPR